MNDDALSPLEQLIGFRRTNLESWLCILVELTTCAANHLLG